MLKEVGNVKGLPFNGVVDKNLSTAQNSVYDWFNRFSAKHEVVGRIFFAIPVAVIDIAIETLKVPLRVIESLALTAINLVGFLFREDCSLKDALKSFEDTLGNFVWFPVSVAVAKFKLVYQLFADLIFAAKVHPYAAHNTYTRSLVHGHHHHPHHGHTSEEAVLVSATV